MNEPALAFPSSPVPPLSSSPLDPPDRAIIEGGELLADPSPLRQAGLLLEEMGRLEEAVVRAARLSVKRMEPTRPKRDVTFRFAPWQWRDMCRGVTSVPPLRGHWRIPVGRWITVRWKTPWMIWGGDD